MSTRCESLIPNQSANQSSISSRQSDRQSPIRNRQYMITPMFRFTVGVEEEFQIIDPDTGELRSHVSELIASGAQDLGDQIKRELHQSIVEVGTKICQDVSELRDEIFRIRRQLAEAA